MPLTRDQLATVFVPAPMFALGSGAPQLLSAGSRVSAWLLDSAAAENVRGSFNVPPSWQTARVDLLWANQGAGAGDVVWSVVGGPATADVALADGFTIPDLTVTAPLVSVVTVTNLSVSLTLTPGPNHLRVQRQAANVADTLANDACFIGVLFTRLS